MNKANIYWIKRKSLTGGASYEKYLYSVLKKNYKLKYIETDTKKSQSIIKKFYNRFKYINMLQNKNIREGTIIRDFFTTALVPFNKKQQNIILIHHIDTSVLKHKIKYKIIKYLFYKNLWKSDKIIVVSKFWKNHFIKRGYKNVFVAYNCFDIKNYDITEKDVYNFKKKYNLNKRQIIYIGNCQKAKGVLETYNALKDLDVDLVTSGRKDVDLLAKHLNLSYKEYLVLLKSSAVVITMSKFDEGWCRTAHESMLLKTPVIGSGRGGMRELLENGHQVICTDYQKLKKIVKYTIKNKKKIGNKGYEYAKKFTPQQFERTWKAIIEK